MNEKQREVESNTSLKSVTDTENRTSFGPENKCQTKYPIVLIHGAGFRDRKLLNYWGRSP